MANTSTVSVAYASNITITETFSVANAADNTILVNTYNQTGTLTASSTVPATVQATFPLTMSGGTGSINLAALPGLDSSQTIDGTGLKAQLLLLLNPSSNANSITVAKGASNGYGWNTAGTSWTVSLSPGQWAMFGGNDVGPDVASGARLLDVTGTGSQVLDVSIVLG